MTTICRLPIDHDGPCDEERLADDWTWRDAAHGALIGIGLGLVIFGPAWAIAWWVMFR